MLNKLDIHNLYRTKKESTEIPFDVFLKKFPSVAKPVNVEKKSDPTEIERVSCMRMKSIKRIAHVFQKNIPAIRVKRTNTDLDKFIYDYSFGIKQDNGEQENTIWTLKRPEGNLFNIQVNDDDNVSMISGYLVKPDYAYYTNGDTSKGVDVINPKKVSLRQEKREKDDVVVNKCMVRLANLLDAKYCSEKIVDGKLTFVMKGVDKVRLQDLSKTSAVHLDKKMSLLEKMNLSMYSEMKLKRICSLLIIVICLLIAILAMTIRK